MTLNKTCCYLIPHGRIIKHTHSVQLHISWTSPGLNETDLQTTLKFYLKGWETIINTSVGGLWRGGLWVFPFPGLTVWNGTTGAGGASSRMSLPVFSCRFSYESGRTHWGVWFVWRHHRASSPSSWLHMNPKPTRLAYLCAYRWDAALSHISL